MIAGTLANLASGVFSHSGLRQSIKTGSQRKVNRFWKHINRLIRNQFDRLNSPRVREQALELPRIARLVNRNPEKWVDA
jgi:hypothetical protein